MVINYCFRLLVPPAHRPCTIALSRTHSHLLAPTPEQWPCLSCCLKALFVPAHFPFFFLPSPSAPHSNPRPPPSRDALPLQLFFSLSNTSALRHPNTAWPLPSSPSSSVVVGSRRTCVRALASHTRLPRNQASVHSHPAASPLCRSPTTPASFTATESAMAQAEHTPTATQGMQTNRIMFSIPTKTPDAAPLEEDLLDDEADEPPELERTPRPSALTLHQSFKASFAKASPHLEQKLSLLTSALHSNNTSPVEEFANSEGLSRDRSYASTWSNNSMSTAELTSDGGLTSPATRTSTPSPTLPPSSFHKLAPAFNYNKPSGGIVSIVQHDESSNPLQRPPMRSSAGESNVEVSLGRKRCISFACGPKAEKKAELEQIKTSQPPQAGEPPKRICTIKFACPTKVSTDAPSKDNKPRRAASPAPLPRRSRASPKVPKLHRDSDSTVRNPSPIASRKSGPRRFSGNSDLARSEAFRFHEFASSEEEVEEWTLESTCHRRPLTIKDTLRIENNLRQLGEEAEEEALDDEEDLDGLDDDEMDLDEDDDDLEEDDNSDEAEDPSSDEGFQTDDEEGFAGSDDESDAGSDYNWWAPGHSTAATSFEHLDIIRPTNRRSVSESSFGSLESEHHHYKPDKTIKRRKSRPVNIRIPTPELPDSTDFVCGTLDEDRPLEDAYLSVLERRRAAKHKVTPQDVDPTFPTSDPEMDEEDEDDEVDHLASESDQHLMMHGQMDHADVDARGRRNKTGIMAKRSPGQSPKRFRSPPPPAKRNMHRSPPPRKLFGQSPRPIRSPPAPIRLRSPPPTRRGSSIVTSPKRPGLSIQWSGLAGRPAPTVSASLPRTPVINRPLTFGYEDDEDTPNEFPVRRAIDIKVGLERKRQRRKEQLYKKKHCKNTKEKRPPPGKGCERMREVGLGLAAHKGKATGFAFPAPSTPDQKDMHVLSV
ncbi:unnamed protein product [Periconia digitata]|uniref:Uncharacterized protein n=1 Tax=Periconia digitata TaxID=1303443 RepID=A0A9W4UH26_9PLEO|nr:unnamed protein product [Periconia digitata]